MKRKFLEDLGLEKEVIDKIMAENGNDINEEKKNTTQAEADRDAFKQQLADAQKSLEGFKDVNVDDLKAQITTLNETIKTNKKQYDQDLADRDFNSAIDTAITGAGAKSAKAVKALLDIDTLKSSKNQEADIKAAIEACQKDNDYLFGSTEPINNPTLPTGGVPSGTDVQMSKMASIMGVKVD